ncbi:VWA domain-containing protein, partial [Ulvibacter litoralis]
MKRFLQFNSVLSNKVCKSIFILFALFSAGSLFSQEITINRTVVENNTECKQFDVSMEIIGDPSFAPQEVVLIIDRSGSMDDGPSPDPIDFAKDAAIEFVNNLLAPANNPTGLNKVSIVSYADSASIDIGLTGVSGKQDIIDAIEDIVTNGNTNIQDGLIKADQVLINEASFNCVTSRSIILLTDGVANRDNNGSQCQNTGSNTICQIRAIQAGVNAQTTTVSGQVYNQNIYSIGLFSAISGTQQTVATSTIDQIQNAGLYVTENEADLSGIYSDILGQFATAALQLPGEPLVMNTLPSGFEYVAGSLSASKGTPSFSGEVLSWYVDEIKHETVTLNYSIRAVDLSVCGNQPTGTGMAVMRYEDSSCGTREENFVNPGIVVPCPVVTASVVNADCFGSSTGSIDLSVTGGYTYTYSWSNGATSQDLMNVPAGTYTVTINDSRGCDPIVESYTVGQSSQITATITAVDGTQAGQCVDGTATANPSGGNSPYTYQWSASAGNQTTQTATNLPAGEHTVVIRDANLCEITKTVIVDCDVEGWYFECGDDVKVDEYGYNANCNENTVVPIPNPGNVYEYVVEIIFKNNNPGEVIQFTDSSGVSHSLVRSIPAGASPNKWVYRGLFAGSTSSVTYDVSSARKCNLQSVVVYAFRNVPLASATAGVFTSQSGYNDVVTIDITIPAFTGPRDVVLEVPISELTPDGRYLKLMGSAGGVSNELFIYGPDASLPGGTCCLAIPNLTLENVPGAATTVTITVDTRSGQNGQTVNGQSWVIAGGVNIDALCYEDLEISLDTKVDVLCYEDNTGSITVNATGGLAPLMYALNGGTPQSSPVFENLTAGTYTVSVTDALANTETLSVTITEPEAISIILTKVNATQTQGCLNGEATASPSGGTPPYTYQWSASAGGQTTQTATNLPAGTHTVIVTDANDCELEQGVVIDCIENCDAVITVDSTTNVLCANETTGSATVSASSIANPAATFTFTWSTGDVVPGVTTSTLNNLGAGVYTVSVTIDGTVCLPVEQSVTITEPASALNVTATSTDESGPATGDGTATANASGGTPPYSYSWSPGGETLQTITGLSAGVYTVTVTDANGCFASASTTVNPGTCLDLAATASATPVSCNGDSDGTATVGVTGGSGTHTYLWSPGNQTTQTITGLSAGIYTVTVTDQVTLCTVQSTTTVNEPGVLSPGIAVTNVSCFGNDTGSLDLTVTGGTAPYTFLWSPNGETTEDLFDLSAGTYSVTITDANGCTVTDSATVQQPASGLSLTSTITDVLCNGVDSGAIDITVLGGTPPYSYSWSNGETTEDLVNVVAGSYTVIVTDANGCTLTESNLVIEEPTNEINIVLTKENATTAQGCTDGEATATVNGGTAPYEYLWSVSAGGQTTATATNLPSGTHTVTVTDANGCTLEQGVVIDCSNTCDAIVVVDGVTDVLCTGDETGSATVSASSIANPTATFTFTWNTVPAQIDANVTTSTLSAVSAGVYTVSVTIDGTICSPVEQSVTITEPTNALNVTATATDESGPTTGDGTATAIPTGGTPPYTYSWAPNGETTQTITGLSAGVYTVTVTDANGCIDTATATVNPGTCLDLTAFAASTPVTCNGDSDGTATATVTGGSGSFTYLWTNGETTAAIIGLSGGSYTVTVTDTVTLCTTEATTTVNEPNVLNSGIAVTNVGCFGNTTGSLDLTVAGGTAPYTFLWSPNGETTEDLFDLAAGVYSVTITDARGCITTDSATIEQPAAGLELSIVSQTDIVCSGTGSVTVEAVGGTTPYLYNVDGGAYQASGVFDNLTVGVHSVTVLDANGCTLSIDVTILTNCILAVDDINDTFVDMPVDGDV